MSDTKRPWPNGTHIKRDIQNAVQDTGDVVKGTVQDAGNVTAHIVRKTGANVKHTAIKVKRDFQEGAYGMAQDVKITVDHIKRPDPPDETDT